MIDNDRIKLLVERSVATFFGANATPDMTDADRQFGADMTELAVGLLQAFNDISTRMEALAAFANRMHS